MGTMKASRQPHDISRIVFYRSHLSLHGIGSRRWVSERAARWAEEHVTLAWYLAQRP